ncbi:MAG: transporter, partial [Desulfuromonadales bacterium]|nr:transporter [Desulfuromonadales bacterium]
MGFHNKVVSFGFVVAALAGICLAGAPHRAEAGIIPYSVIGAHEFDLPVKFEPFNAILSYNVYRDEDKAWS